jgi:stage II sporulation protein AA (anti-sigma F factor antagonist)
MRDGHHITPVCYSPRVSPPATPKRRLIWSLAIDRRDLLHAHVVAASGRLGAASAVALATALNDALAAGHRRLLLDCSGLDYVSSAGLAVIEHAAAELDKAGGALVLCGAQEPVRVSFEVSGADAGLLMADSVAEALKRLSGFAEA